MNDETAEMDEAPTGSTTESPAFAPDDPRFEVKWRKKPSNAASPPPADSETPASNEIGELRAQLAEAEKRAGELQDRWHRAEANLANLRKRNEQERGEIEKFAAMMLVAELLPVLDNFDRALKTVPGNLGMLTWVQGVMLVERHLRAILEHQGVTPVEAENQPFNPHFHEAIGERESDTVAPGNVLQVYQQGYTMHGRVIRPALVELATAPAPVADTPTTETESNSETPAAPAADAGA